MMVICGRATLFTNAAKFFVIDGLYVNFFLNITMGCLK